MSEGRKRSDTGIRFGSKINGVEGKTPFLIGVAGGTASGKVRVLFECSLKFMLMYRFLVQICVSICDGTYPDLSSCQVILLLTVCRSVRLGLEPLIVTHGHVLTWKEISVLFFVGRPL
jgi:hypothetical protein